MKKHGLIMSVRVRNERGQYQTLLHTTEARYANRAAKECKNVYGSKFAGCYPFTGILTDGEYVVRGCMCGTNVEMIGKRPKNKLLRKVNVKNSSPKEGDN